MTKLNEVLPMSHRALSRARRSLYQFPIELSPAGTFLFAGWLRLESKALRSIRRTSGKMASALSWWPWSSNNQQRSPYPEAPERSHMPNSGTASSTVDRRVSSWAIKGLSMNQI
jgi:hypothetical protein